MSTSLQYAHELLDRMTEEQVRSVVEQLEKIVWNGEKRGDYGIEDIRNIISPIAKRHGVARVYLFGSRARGDNRPDSDYDFMISTGNAVLHWGMADILNDMEEALHAPVDLITDGINDDKLIAQARKDAVLLYEQAG